MTQTPSLSIRIFSMLDPGKDEIHVKHLSMKLVVNEMVFARMSCTAGKGIASNNIPHTIIIYVHGMATKFDKRK